MVHKRKGLFFLLVVSSLFQLHATGKKRAERNILVELKGSYVLPADKTFRDIYHQAGAATGEVMVQMKPEKPFFGWASVGVIPLKGTSIGGCSKTKATIIPLAAGLKYFINFNPGNLYVGGGILGAHLKTKDDSPFVIHERSKWGVGGIAKLGFLFDLPQSWFIDLFSDYSFVKVKFAHAFECGVQSHKANVSHWSLGLGVGYRFA